MSSTRISERFLVRVTIAWLAVLGLVPWLHDRESTFFASISLIITNAAFTLRCLTYQRRVPVFLNLFQLVLFGVANYQLCCTFGDEHYRFDRPPGFFDWVEFALAHVARAADVFDAIDEYGLDVQAIHHDSFPSRILIVAMHLGADVFLLGLVLRWWGSVRKTPGENLLARGRRLFRWFFITLAIYVVVGLTNPFSAWDWLLWPMDNVLRLLDIGDMFQVFRVKLHGVEPSFLTSSASLAFRIAFGGWTADILLWLHFTLFRGWGIDVEELQELLREGDVFARQGAARTLAASGKVAGPAIDDLIAALADHNVQVRCDAAQALGQIGPRAGRAVPALALCLWSDHRELRLRAATALLGIGDAAEPAVIDLIYLRVVGDEALRKIAGRTLIRFGYVPVEELEADSI